jgi:hypothetical protein
MEQPQAGQEGAALPNPQGGEPPPWGSHRKRIRDDLDRFLTNQERPISRNHFAALLNAAFETNATEVTIRRFLNSNAKSVDDDVVRAIDAYLDRYVRPAWATEETENQLIAKSLFEVMRAFFHMRPDDARRYRNSVPGTYQFYAYSELERGRDAVCFGAIEFAKDFSVEELQTSTEENGETINEEFQGHYIYHEKFLIAMLRNKDGWKPKFYILSIDPYPGDDGKRQSLTGSLLKVGEKQRHVFGATIHMLRYKDAFKDTDVIPRDSKKVSTKLLETLDSQEWLPK